MSERTKTSDTVSGRRDFLKSAGAVAAGLYLAGGDSPAKAQDSAASGSIEALAINGGPKTVPPHSFATRWPIYGDEEEREVISLLRSAQNPYGTIAPFEKAWCEFHDMPYAKAHCNGTSALTSMIFALQLPPQSEVLVPDRSTHFPVVPMRFFDYVPVWVDVNPKTMNIDLDDCKRKLTSKTKAIMPVHWFGLPCDMDQICDFGKEHGLEVVEDASHAHGASLKDPATGKQKYIGTWGRMSGYSLQATKPLPAIEGGIAMYHNRDDYELATAFGNYNLPKDFEGTKFRKYQGAALGSKLRIHPIAAVLARIQLKSLVARNNLAAGQVKQLNDRILQLPGLSAPPVRPDCKRVYYCNNIIFIDPAKAGMSREACIKALVAEGVVASPHDWEYVHEDAVFQEAKWWRYPPKNPGELPGTKEANETAILLPLFTSEQPELIDQYAKAFEKVWAHRKELA